MDTSRCEFSILDPKVCPNKSKLSIYVEICYPDQFEYAQFNGDIQFFCFQAEILFLGEFGPKNKNCQFELKFGTYINLNI